MSNRFKKTYKYLDGRFKKFALTAYLLIFERKAQGVIFREPKNKLELNQMFRLRYQVYCEEYLFLDRENYPNKMETDIDDNRSKHIVALKDGEVIGCARLILPSERPLPTEKEYSLTLKNKNQTAEVSRLIVKKEYRTTKVGIGLYRGIYHLCVAEGYVYILEAMERELARWINYLFLRFKPIAKVKNYFNTPNAAYIADVFEISKAIKNDNLLLYLYLNHKLPKFKVKNI